MALTIARSETETHAASQAPADGPPTVQVVPRLLPRRKRAFDLIVAIPVLIVTMPVTLALAAISTILYRTDPVFRQPRLGHGGSLFTLWKIRTLPTTVSETANKYQLSTLPLPRLAQVVRFRHLDELPQLLMVVSGKMSIVGPRPEMPTLAASFNAGFVAERLTVHPGCTGLWQVSVRARNLIGEHPEFDVHYVRNWTLRLDAWVLYRTILAIGFGREIDSVEDIPRWTGAGTHEI